MPKGAADSSLETNRNRLHQTQGAPRSGRGGFRATDPVVVGCSSVVCGLLKLVGVGMSFLEPSTDIQRAVLDVVVDVTIDRADAVATDVVSPTQDAVDLRRVLGDLDLEEPLDAREAVDWVAEYLGGSMVHTTSPRYFGLFNPSPSFMGIVGDLMAAAYNPQLAAWSHAPGPVEMEAWLIRRGLQRSGGPRGGHR